MATDERYEILDTIAKGEFATVSRARDRDLGREVAIKQIHAQYLADPRQLARYWQEAQLLASLQHPNIVTIYDVVRPRGWLILELMRSSLKPAAEGEPMDLDQLRAVLMNCLNGLAFLHSNSVIHGDVKPSNILVGTQNRVKIGDFGLARRASNEEGSLLKGTTKYMAPELLSKQFGAVGPASDLYSLGFTAYELMVGKHFESLLPTLATFGRDKQLAWMMWHSTADVKLPDIQRVLEGVPDDLAHVIQRLIAKDQSQRYASADQALADLHRGGPMLDSGAPGLDAEAEAALAARKKRRIRNLAVACGGLVVILCALIAMKTLNQKVVPKAAPTTEIIDGTICKVYPDSMEIGVVPRVVDGIVDAAFPKSGEVDVAPTEGGNSHRVKIKDEDIIKVGAERRTINDLKPGDNVDITFMAIPLKLKGQSITINDKPNMIDELVVGDEVEIVRRYSSQKHDVITEVHVRRRGSFAAGRLISKDNTLRTLDIKSGDEDKAEIVKVFVPAGLQILLNGRPTFQDKPVTLAILTAGDRVTAHFDPEGNVNKANKIEARRQVQLKGTLAADYDARSRLLSVIDGNQQIVKLPFGPDYKIYVNHDPVEPAGLKRGDRVSIKHDTYISEVVAQRTLGAEGVVEQIRFEPPQSLSVTGDGGQKMTYLVGPECKIMLGGEDVPFEVLRAGDRVSIEHGAIDAKSQSAIAATSIAAERPTDPSRWALIVGVENYDDTKMTKLPYPLADAAALGETMTKRYRVPAEQLRIFSDPSAVTLQRELPEFLKRVPAEGRLIVYYVGHAAKDDSGETFLALKDFRSDQPAVNGQPLQWLADLMEECPAKEKLLLLDASHAGGGAEEGAEPSSAEMLASLKRQPNRALLRTVTAIASCQKGQKGIDLADKQHGLFAECLIEGYGGAADANHDTRVEPTELFAFLQKRMISAGQGKETPELFLPDDRPPRLTEAAKKSIRRLAGFAAQVKIDGDEVDQEYSNALQAAGSEPEPRLIYGLLLIKRKAREKAMQHFEVVKSEMPDRLLPYAALAWLQMEKRHYAAAVNELAAMVNHIPKPARPDLPNSPEAQYLFHWAGQLREHASGVGDTSQRPLAESTAALDAAVGAHGIQAMELYSQGRQASAAVLADFEKRMAAATDDADISKLKVDRKQLSNFADFPLNKYIQLILMHLDE